ncbi:hypothetical protein [Mesorhizobium ventifaucium]|uniref:Uncharacterized protein n=1 Tax=Mesorhizobium ventifaucium TaxID=666020 RepID=A0ABN8J943_9HYPH|nr:hypothetical protein [Mesorhizobium ventifaucium]CAH2394265.1 hypothetical protein MES4922_10178 [Mesorhizobium ventifaucium]
MTTLPKRLGYMAADDANNFVGSIVTLIEDLPFLDELEGMFDDFQNRNRVMGEGEMKYYALCHLARVATLKACTASMRQHTSDGFSSSRQATDAAFYAVMMSIGRMTEDQYLNDFKHRNTLQGKIRKEIEKSGLPADIPPIVVALQTVFYSHSKHAHADPMALANRVIQHPGGKVSLSFYQAIEDDADFRYFFLGMLWVGGMCLKAFVDIQQSVFGEDVTSFDARITAFKAKMIAQRQAIGVFPDKGVEYGF